ncbi:4Fe-4S binding protein [bacterium]|nr:4Fe-4S binding protein [bacterium]
MNKLIIDGIEVTPDPSRTVLEIATELGIEIPTLCHYKALSPYGACRICVVEVIWKGESKLQTACTFPGWEGEIRTNSEMVKRARKLLLELYLARAPKSTEIRELAQKYGVEKTRMDPRANETAPQTAIGFRDPQKCINCGLCVRVCNDLMGIGAIGFEGRGHKRTVGTPFDQKSETCVVCGACAAVCLTKAINIKNISGLEPKPVLSEFNMGLQQRSSVYIPFPQAVPKVPVISEQSCMYFFNQHCRACEKFCGSNAIDFEPNEKKLELDIGAIVVATGFDQFNPEEKPELGYRDYVNVISGLEFERLISPSGPTGGEILIAGQKPKKVVLVHCVGSRDSTVGNPYCSRVCCMYLMKHAHLIKEKMPKAQVTAFYIDIRAFGKGYEEFYDRVRAEDVFFRRGSVSEIFKRRGTLIVKAEDTLTGEPVEEEADLVILGTGIVPRHDVTEMGRILKIVQSQDRFYLEAHPKLRPVDTFSEGVFLAGCCQAPKDIPDTVAQAKAAASSVAAILSKKKLTVPPIVAIVDEDVCAGCRSCEQVCEFKAHIFDENRMVMTINTILCKGCGNCVATCPSSAIRMNVYTNEQLLAELDSILKIIN